MHRHLAQLVRLQLPVLIVPRGSGNDFARALNLRSASDALQAWRQFASGKEKENVRSIDLGVITSPVAGGAPAPHEPLRSGNQKPETGNTTSVASPGSDSTPRLRAAPTSFPARFAATADTCLASCLRCVHSNLFQSGFRLLTPARRLLLRQVLLRFSTMVQ